MIEYKGKVQSMKQWSKELDLPYNRIKQRISTYHWTVERAFEYKQGKLKNERSAEGKKEVSADKGMENLPTENAYKMRWA